MRVVAYGPLGWPLGETMERLEAKKFTVAIVGIVMLLLAVRTISVAVSEPRNLDRPLYIVMGLVMAHPPGGAPEPAESMPNWDVALDRADLKAGRTLSRQCAACHDLSAANTNIVGPGLHDVFDRVRASHAGFQYSGAMLQQRGKWTPDNLFVFLRNPQLSVPWTRMSFAGIKGRQDRINLIAFLRANGME